VISPTKDWKVYHPRSGNGISKVLELRPFKFWALDHPHSGSRVPPKDWKKQRGFEGGLERSALVAPLKDWK